MEIPSQEGHAFSNLILIQNILRFTRDSLANTEFDDLRLISDLDSATLCLVTAIHRMEDIIKKSQEPKSVCY